MPITRLPVPQTNHLRAPLRLAAGLWFARTALRELRRRDSYDLVVVGTNPPPSPIVGLANRKACDTPYVYLIHDLYPDIAVALGSLSQHGLVSDHARRLQKRWLHSAAGVVVLGRCMRDYIVSTYQLPVTGSA